VVCAGYSAAEGEFGAASLRSSGQDFSDAAGYGLLATRYMSVRLVDLDGDGAADVCGRADFGIECADNDGSGRFAPATRRLESDFTDALGWGLPSSGDTIMFGDIDGDGDADVCGRGTAGIRCAENDGSGQFDGAYWAADTNDFSDLEGWNLRASAYASLRLADISGDGRADVCGRAAQGLQCGLSLGTSFANAQLVTWDGAFSDAAGFGADEHGASLAFGDLDGDGHLDACARGPRAGEGVALHCSHAF
jgi:hypothetical protein